MPGSAISAHSSGSHLSSSSSRARQTKSRQYFRVAATSQVDESLFGETNRAKDIARLHEEKAAEAAPIELQAATRKNKNGKKSKRETVQVITKDLIRNLIVPIDDPSGKSLIMNGYEFDRIRSAARVLTAEDRQRQAELMKRAKEEAINGVHERKEYMKLKDIERKKNEKLNELEEEERVKGEHLREKANEQLQEQEDEIKHLNELILNAKCHAIRDAQILEKGQIAQEMQSEEQRLDQMMELDRVNAIHVDEEIEKKRKTERLIGAMKIMEQIQENEQERLLDLERKDQENRTMQKYLEKLFEEDADKLERKRMEQLELREDLNKCNEEIVRRKELSKEQEKMIEEKVLEYQRAKAERESAFEREQERIRIEKEKEVARLRSLQERARDEQAERDATRAKRQSEQAEREWRKKEAAEARQKAETEEMLKHARAQQMNQKEHFLAVEAQRERAEFEKVLRAQQELNVKDQQEESKRAEASRVYAGDVRAQIREKEQLRISERNAFFEEGIKLDEEARQRRAKLEAVKRKKLEALRQAGLPERYVAEVARKVNVPQPVS